MKKQYITNSAQETKKLGEELAKELLKTKKYLVVGLKGELGAGKTTFLQGFAKGLGIKEKILSPTFVILKKFKIPKRKNVHCSLFIVHWFYHIDCYRISKVKELLGLGFKEIISNPENIVVIEWADRIKKIMPENSAWIEFNFVDEKTRKIIFLRDFNFMLRLRNDRR